MRKTINREVIAGKIYEHALAIKVTGESSKAPGTTYIGGTIDIATDNECLNIVQVNFTYVTETTKAGKKNNTFGVLKNIIENGKTVLNDGAENATCVKIDASLGLNDFYTDRNGDETLVSAKRNTGSFASVVTNLGDESSRNTFECDMLINNTQYVEADEEKHIDKDYLIVKGAVFDFRGAILPVEFKVKSPGGIKYFESLDITPKNLVFTKVWGHIISEVIKTKAEEESAFGEAKVKEYSRTVKDWVIDGTSKKESIYEIGDAENGITQEEIKKALADREVYLADVKKKQDEYKASKAAADTVPFGTPAKATASAAEGGFDW